MHTQGATQCKKRTNRGVIGEEALEEFQAAVRLDPNYQEAQQNAARAARSLERR